MAAAWLLNALYMAQLGARGGGAGDVYLQANTSSGTVRGVVDFQPKVPVAKFFGIPYARPPTGPRRFRAPEPPQSWTGTLDTVKFRNQCMQRSIDQVWMRNGEDQPRSEDCLYLNVYTPTDRTAMTSLPVMVWIHGGGYSIGAGSQYDATSLAAQGVVMVTINYRLDVFGFLSTEDDVMPGNYGMMDQIAALKWVQQNIASFGGDPGQVTVFGESAGSSSVSFLILSPLAKGLFKRAIMESGSVFSPWAMYSPGNRVSPRTSARLVSVFADCNDLDNSTELLECLQAVDANTLLNCSLDVFDAVGADVLWDPRVETTYGFLPEYPTQLLSRGEFNHVDTIRGFNADEMGNVLKYSKAKIGDTFEKNMTKEKAMDIFKNNLVDFTLLTRDIISEQFSQIFLTGAATSMDILRNLQDGLDALMFHGPILQELEMASRAAAAGDRHFLYQFSHKPSWLTNVSADYISAVHTDEIFFVFNVSQKQVQDSEKGPANAADRRVSRQCMDLWLSFAKTGSPSSAAPGSAAWPPYSNAQPNYLDIDETSNTRQFVDRRYVDLFRKVLEQMDGSKADATVGIVG